MVGSAATIGSTVDLYSDPGCTALLATGTAGELASGIKVPVADNTTNSIYATATAGGTTSSCSGPLTYIEDSRTAPAPPAFDVKSAKRHCRKKFRGKRRAKCIKRAKQRAKVV